MFIYVCPVSEANEIYNYYVITYIQQFLGPQVLDVVSLYYLIVVKLIGNKINNDYAGQHL